MQLLGDINLAAVPSELRPARTMHIQGLVPEPREMQEMVQLNGKKDKIVWREGESCGLSKLLALPVNSQQSKNNDSSHHT